MRNTVVAYSVAGNGWNPISCTRTLTDGGGNFQWPIDRAGGARTTPTPCAPQALQLIIPLLGALADNGGPTRTVLPADGSPVLGAGTGCRRPTSAASRVRDATAELWSDKRWDLVLPSLHAAGADALLRDRRGTHVVAVAARLVGRGAGLRPSHS